MSQKSSIQLQLSGNQFSQLQFALASVPDIKNLLKDQQSYKQLAIYKQQVLHRDGETAQTLIASIREILEDPSSDKMQRLLAMRLAKEIVDTHDDESVFLVQEGVLPAFFEIAKFDVANPDPDRAKEEQQIGNSMVRLALECIFVWAIWYPKNQDDDNPSPFKMRYQDLSNQGAVFPKLNFYKVEDVKKLYQLKNQTLQYQEKSIEEEIKIWNEKNKKMKEKLISFQSLKTERGSGPSFFRQKSLILSVQNAGFMKRQEELVKQLLQKYENTLEQEELFMELLYWVDFAKFFQIQSFKFKAKQIQFIQFKSLWTSYDQTPDGNDTIPSIKALDERKQLTQISGLVTENEKLPNKLPQGLLQLLEENFRNQDIGPINSAEPKVYIPDDEEQTLNLPQLIEQKDKQILVLRDEKSRLLQQIDEFKNLIIELQLKLKSLTKKLNNENQNSNEHSTLKKQSGGYLSKIVIEDDD